MAPASARGGTRYKNTHKALPIGEWSCARSRHRIRAATAGTQRALRGVGHGEQHRSSQPWLDARGKITMASVDRVSAPYEVTKSRPQVQIRLIAAGSYKLSGRSKTGRKHQNTETPFQWSANTSLKGAEVRPISNGKPQPWCVKASKRWWSHNTGITPLSLLPERQKSLRMARLQSSSMTSDAIRCITLSSALEGCLEPRAAFKTAQPE